MSIYKYIHFVTRCIYFILLTQLKQLNLVKLQFSKELQALKRVEESSVLYVKQWGPD